LQRAREREGGLQKQVGNADIPLHCGQGAFLIKSQESRVKSQERGIHRKGPIRDQQRRTNWDKSSASSRPAATAYVPKDETAGQACIWLTFLSTRYNVIGVAKTWDNCGALAMSCSHQLHGSSATSSITAGTAK